MSSSELKGGRDYMIWSEIEVSADKPKVAAVYIGPPTVCPSLIPEVSRSIEDVADSLKDDAEINRVVLHCDLGRHGEDPLEIRHLLVHAVDVLTHRADLVVDLHDCARQWWKGDGPFRPSRCLPSPPRGMSLASRVETVRALAKTPIDDFVLMANYGYRLTAIGDKDLKVLHVTVAPPYMDTSDLHCDLCEVITAIEDLDERHDIIYLHNEMPAWPPTYGRMVELMVKQLALLAPVKLCHCMQQVVYDHDPKKEKETCPPATDEIE